MHLLFMYFALFQYIQVVNSLLWPCMSVSATLHKVCPAHQTRGVLDTPKIKVCSAHLYWCVYCDMDGTPYVVCITHHNFYSVGAVFL